jgi:hypothetical protein
VPRSCTETTISDLLNDPLTQAVMRADRVDPRALRHMLGAVAAEIQSPARAPDYKPHWFAPPGGRAGIGRWFRSQLCEAC